MQISIIRFKYATITFNSCACNLLVSHSTAEQQNRTKKYTEIKQQQHRRNNTVRVVGSCFFFAFHTASLSCQLSHFLWIEKEKKKQRWIYWERKRERGGGEKNVAKCINVQIPLLININCCFFMHWTCYGISSVLSVGCFFIHHRHHRSLSLLSFFGLFKRKPRATHEQLIYSCAAVGA